MDLQNIARTYLNMLPGGTEIDLPRIEVVNQLSSKWDAIAMWMPRHPIPGVIQIQKRGMSELATVERLVAHEVCHYWAFHNLFVLKEGTRSLLGHEASGLWYKAAQVINGKVGDPEFITEFSDASYATKNTKSFYVLVVKGRSELGWVWFSRLTENMINVLGNLMLSKPVAIVKTDRDAFLQSGAKLPRIAVPTDEAMGALLEDIYTKYAKMQEPHRIREILNSAPKVARKN